jgi:hypothetical protein
MNHAERVKLALEIEKRLDNFNYSGLKLAGLRRQEERASLAWQVVDSICRVEWVYTISNKKVISEVVCQAGPAFDPLKAAVILNRKGNFDEACWLVFLAINFGKHKTSGWLLCREIYGALGAAPFWTWKKVSADSTTFTSWLKCNHMKIKGKFGNHRKYESLNPTKLSHTGQTIETYVQRIVDAGGHTALFNPVGVRISSPEEDFSLLYKSFFCVKRFGRTATFDYLTMISKIGLANLEPDKAYISSSTGPKSGVNLLLGRKKSDAISTLNAESLIKSLGNHLPVSRMVMQVMEDAICNWQKSPSFYRRFSG